MAEVKHEVYKLCAQFFLPLALNVLGLLIAGAIHGVITDMIVLISPRPRDQARSKTMTGIQWILFGSTLASVFALIGMFVKTFCFS